MFPKSRTPRKVAQLVETSRSYGRDLLLGIARFSQTRSNWSLLHQEMAIDALLPDWIREAKVSGVIARVDSRTVKPLKNLQVPIVDVRCSRSYSDIPQIETNDQ